MNEDIEVEEDIHVIEKDLRREENPPPRVNQPKLRDFNANAYGWNQYRLNPIGMDVTSSIVLPPLLGDAKFTKSSGLLQMLKKLCPIHRATIRGSPPSSPKCCLLMQKCHGDINMSIDAVVLRVFPLSLIGNVALWLCELPPGTITS